MARSLTVDDHPNSKHNFLPSSATERQMLYSSLKPGGNTGHLATEYEEKAAFGIMRKIS